MISISNHPLTNSPLWTTTYPWLDTYGRIAAINGHWLTPSFQLVRPKGLIPRFSRFKYLKPGGAFKWRAWRRRWGSSSFMDFHGFEWFWMILNGFLAHDVALFNCISFGSQTFGDLRPDLTSAMKWISFRIKKMKRYVLCNLSFNLNWSSLVLALYPLDIPQQRSQEGHVPLHGEPRFNTF